MPEYDARTSYLRHSIPRSTHVFTQRSLRRRVHILLQENFSSTVLLRFDAMQ